MTCVRFNVTIMFNHREPYDCSNNRATLGDQCARLTWTCALEVASAHESWLLSPLEDAVDYILAWAKETGAWDRDEIAGWTDEECLALLVQNVASDMRMLGSDDMSFLECLDVYESTDWNAECEYPTTMLSLGEDGVLVEGEVCS